MEIKVGQTFFDPAWNSAGGWDSAAQFTVTQVHEDGSVTGVCREHDTSRPDVRVGDSMRCFVEFAETDVWSEWVVAQ